MSENHDNRPSTRRPPQFPKPEIYLQISEPKIEIIEIGQTVTLKCSASSQRTQVKYS